MTDATAEFFEEYDALALDVTRSRHQFFADNLSRWFSTIDGRPWAGLAASQLEAGVDFDDWYERCLRSQGGMVGSGRLTWPPGSQQRLGLELALLRRFASGKLAVRNFAHAFLYSDNFDQMAQDVASQIFDPASAALRRRLTRAISPSGAAPVSAPASDRTVPLDHNSQTYKDAADALAQIEQAVTAANDYDDEDDRQQRVAEISAARRMLQATRVRAEALWAVVGQPLRWLAEKFAGGIVGQLAGAAWKLVLKLLDVS